MAGRLVFGAGSERELGSQLKLAIEIAAGNDGRSENRSAGRRCLEILDLAHIVVIEDVEDLDDAFKAYPATKAECAGNTHVQVVDVRRGL